MEKLNTLTYETTGRIARLTLNRPERGNGITLDMPNEIAVCVERANLNSDVSVIALTGNGKGFCGGYDLVLAAEQGFSVDSDSTVSPEGSPLDPRVQLANHDPEGVWDPMIDYAMMSRNVRGFMSLFFGETCDWGLAIEAPAADKLDERFEYLLERIARVPVSQLIMMKLMINQTLMSQGLYQSQMLGTILDGVARHTKEGYAFQRRAAEAGFKEAVRERDEQFGDPSFE